MYFEHFGLNRPPFEETTNPTFHYETTIHRAIVERITARLQHGGIVLIQGDEGLGKSMLGQVLLKRFGHEVTALSFSVPAGDAAGGPPRARAGSGLENLAGASSQECVRRIVETVSGQGQPRCLVLIDQAENLTADDLLVLQRLVNESAGEKLKLTIVLRAARLIEATLRCPELRLMARQLVKTPELAPLTAAEVVEYVATRLTAAGNRGEDLFTEGALQRLAEVSRGVPRRINLLAKRALIQAAGRGTRQVDTKMLEGCIAETPVAPPRFEPVVVASPPAPEADLGTTIDRQVDAAMRKLDEQVEQVVRETLNRVERVCSAAQSPGGLAAIAEDGVARLEQATSRADSTSARIEKAVRRLKQVGETAEQRVALLLNSLETADGIHDRLEVVGREVTTLVDESQRTLSAEHERLLSVVDEVSQQRAEFDRTLKALREDREAALAENRRIVQEQVGQMRESTLAARREIEGTLEKTREQSTESIREIRDSIRTVADDAGHVLASAQSSEAETKAQLAKVEAQSVTYDARLRAMSEAQAAAAELTRRTAGTAERIERSVTLAHEALKALESRTAAAQRSKKEIVAELEQVGTGAHNRIAEQLGRLESVVAVEKDTRQQAEEAARLARTALAKATESEANLARAQEAAISVESIATTALTGVQRQIKRVEESVEVVVNYGLDKARTSVGELLDDAQKQLTATALATQSTAGAAQEEIAREVEERSAALQEQGEALADSVQSMRRDMESSSARVLSQIRETGTQAVETQEEACRKALDRVVAAEVLFGNKLESGKRALSTTSEQAVDAVRSAADAASDQITQRVEETMAELESGKRALSTASEQAADAVRSAADTASGQITQRVEETMAELESGKRALSTTSEQAADAVRSAADAASDQITQRVEETMAELESGKRAIRTASDQAVEAANGAADAATDQITRHVDETMAGVDTLTREAISRINDATTERGAQAEAKLSEMSRNSLCQLEQQAAQVAERTHRDLEASVTPLVSEASATIEGLDKALGAVQQSIAEVGTGREQIDHMLRDVWSLTTTTDSRVRAMEDVAENAEKLRNAMTEMLKKASTQAQRLNAQSGEAERSAGTMAAQHEKVKQICATFSQRIAEAAKVTGEIGHTTTAGKKLAAEMAGQISQLDERLAAAREVVVSIEAEDVRTRETAARVVQLATHTRALEARLNELQRGLADPVSRIQDAQAQAEELNGVCLAVKRVFRGVSQASLQAEERLKALARMLSAAKQTSKGIQQWVEEAGRARERLASVLQAAPSIDQTHPVASLPDNHAEDDLVPETVIDAGDRALLLGLTKTSEGSAKTPAGKSQLQNATRGKVTAAAPINRDPKVMKRVESLADVLKAKKATGQSSRSGTGKRIQPEEVRALIEQANRAAVAKR